MASGSKKKYQLASDFLAATGLLPWDGGYEMMVGIWQNSERITIRRAVQVTEGISASFGAPCESWWRALTDTPEEAALLKVLHDAKNKGGA